VRPEDWRTWRDLRLEGLRDTPIGFGRTYEEERQRPDESWQTGGTRPGLRVLARAGGRAVGMAGVFRDDTDLPVVYAVYVTPAARGQGVLAALVDVLAAWAAPDALVLDVHEDNARARRAYEKLGFTLTGGTTPGGIDGRDLQRMRRS